MKIATYNVNSIRARQDRLVAWLGRAQPDVVCLQELKVADDEFPHEALAALGYHAAIFGQRTYNGVAILSKAEPVDVVLGFDNDPGDDQARVIAVTTGGARIISAYIPNGQTVGSDKFAYKLRWLARFKAWLAATHSPDQAIVVCGDFNVAPEDRDVARPDEWRDSVLCHDDARRALAGLFEWGLVDTIRLHHEGPGPYSWWDYRMLGFPKGNGLRIDHILATKPMAARCTNAWVEREERKGKLPSDHAPVIAEFRESS
ncbi:MAG: exodeoxyribonuclease III [Gemmatimonadota bacterium]